MFDHDEIEKITVKFWYDLLSNDQVNLHTDFFVAGGDDLLFKSLLLKIKKKFNMDISDLNRDNFSTLYQQIATLKKHFNISSSSCVLTIQKGSKENPILIFVHPIGGSLFPFMPLIKKLNIENTIYGIQDSMLLGDMRCYNSLSDQANFYVSELPKEVYQKKIILLGYSSGGSIANLMAQQLISLGSEIQHLVLFDSWTKMPQGLSIRDKFKAIILRQFDKIKPYEFFETQQQVDLWLDVLWNRMRLVFKYQPVELPVDATIFIPKEAIIDYTVDKESIEGWAQLLRLSEVCSVPGNHENMLDEIHVADISQKIHSILQKLAEKAN